MKYKFHFQIFIFIFTFKLNYKEISFQNANYFYFHILFKNNFIFKLQTIFTLKFNSKLSFMYKYQRDSDGPPYFTCHLYINQYINGASHILTNIKNLKSFLWIKPETK